MTTRRDFLKSLTAAAAMVGSAGAPKFSFAQEAGGKTFIKVFMRGGADGLHLFPLYGDDFYYTYRPDMAIERPSDSDGNTAIDLGPAAGGMRGMNPNLEPLMDIWDAGNMMIAPATSFNPNNRSHFDCQRWIGTGARNNLIDGYLNRYMQQDLTNDHPLRGVVAGKTSISTEIRGELRVPAVFNRESFDLRNGDFCMGDGCSDNQLTDLMREISSHDVDLPGAEGEFRDTQVVLLDTIAEVQAAGASYTPADGVTYTNSDLGRGLRLCAQLIKAGVPLEVAALDWNIGWDTHSDQIPGNNAMNRFTDQNFRYHRRMAEGARDFAAFYRDLGADMSNVVVLVGSEFGRTKKQNGSRGSDHGEGGSWFAFGGPTQQAIAPDVSTIDDSMIDRNWLPTVTNYRNIVGEIMVRHMGMSQQLISTIFPNHSFEDYSLFRGASS
ncbi:DUF1501 domain-containing protein [Yoonia sp. 2307UL14-13]|uniref:DUF1501 domain-containing protein n=1 Tax=Yoonia sp. 2307UL14-13 TaxID=3126506 RepID=UPI0030A72279